MHPDSDACSSKRVEEQADEPRRADAASLRTTSAPTSSDLNPAKHSLCSLKSLGDERVELVGDVWTFDRAGKLSPGDPTRQHARYSVRRGINRAAKSVLAAAPRALLITSKRISSIHGSAGNWKLTCDQDEEHGPFAAVVVTAPAPQAAPIVAPASHQLAQKLGEVTYDAQFSIALALLEPAPVEPGIGALLNSDREHPIAWVTVEERKPGHAPDEGGLLVVQMSPEWTRAHYETRQETVSAMAQAHIENLLGARVCEEWSDVQRWRYALPTSALDPATADVVRIERSVRSWRCAYRQRPGDGGAPKRTGNRPPSRRLPRGGVTISLASCKIRG